MSRAHNFCPGPCTLPVSVLEELSDEMVEYRDSGMSVIEMSHRSAEYEAIHNQTVDRLRSLAGAPDDIEVLLLQGGATLQFAMVPQNLLGGSKRAGYVVGGAWGTKALADASKIGDVYTAWSDSSDGPASMPDPDQVTIEDGTTFLHVTSNETIEGSRMIDFDYETRLVADMSSDYLSRPIDWDHFDLVYGGAQKNLGPAGLAVVFIRSSLLEEASDHLPSYLRYDTHAKANSLANTPPVFSIWAMGKVLAWMEGVGGVDAMEKRATERSSLVYDTIDTSNGFYHNPVEGRFRSQTNIVFTLPTTDLEAEFLVLAKAEGLLNLKGHRSVGGMRASIYNGLPTLSVEALVQFMGHFAQKRG
ncbi:MAG: 3-phosphoserine/phosphohydroxythreonine transaminase [Actinomycetia bacterium]|nr:3-phosphoserine/phosphohydroxythreonine transaminase [Actinomycetes bacterium]